MVLSSIRATIKIFGVCVHNMLCFVFKDTKYLLHLCIIMSLIVKHISYTFS